MTRLRRITGMLLALLLALTILPAAAEEEAADPLENLSQFEGIEYAVSRSWSVDFEAMFAVTPENEGDDPFADMTGLWFIYGVVVELEEDGNAEDMYDYFANISDEELLADLDDEEAEADISREELDDIGDQAEAISIESTGGDTEGFYRYTFSQAGEYFFITIAVSTDAESAAAADDLLAYLADQDDHSGLGDYDPENADPLETAYTDGLWDFFPDDDEEFLAGLIFAGDEVLYPEDDIEVDEG